MTIKVITQTTQERMEETKKLYEQCKPYLKEGYTLGEAVQKVKNINHTGFYKSGWFKELKEYHERKKIKC